MALCWRSLEKKTHIQDWEEITDMSLVTLNRELQRMKDGDDANWHVGRRRLDYAYIKFETMHDLEKLKKHMNQTLELLVASSVIGTIRESPAEESSIDTIKEESSK